MQKVLTGVEAPCCIMATTVDESIPPDKNAPNGTSERILRATDRRISRSSSSIASCSLPSKRLTQSLARDPLGGPEAVVCAVGSRSAEPNDRAWRYLVNVLDDALVAGNDAVAEEGRDGGAIEPRSKRGELVERLELGCEGDAEVALHVQQRFDPESITNERQTLRLVIP